jgi:putative tricarboxylic transport membrane protein
VSSTRACGGRGRRDLGTERVVRRRREAAVILRPLLETQARRALVGSGGDLRVFVGRPLTAVLLLIALAAAVLPHVPAIMARLRGRDGGPGAFGAAEE